MKRLPSSCDDQRRQWLALEPDPVAALEELAAKENRSLEFFAGEPDQ